MSSAASIQFHPGQRQHRVSRYLYGQFAEHIGRCVYGGIWVGEDSRIENDGGLRLDTVRALKRLKLPVLRWPGGCFADNYHWMDGIGPRDRRPKRLNMHWLQGESNAFGTDEFIRFCRLIDTEPYICLNVGSGAVEEARSWVEYCNAAQNTTLTQLRAENGYPDPHHVKFWGIGNENWGCGGHMHPRYYADIYRRFATYVQPTAGQGARMIACGSHPGIPEWDRLFLEEFSGMHAGTRRMVDYLAVHIYSGGGISDLEFSEADYLRLVIDAEEAMEAHVRRTIGVAQAFSTDAHRIDVILDEWGTWYKEASIERGTCQQSTMQDALFTAISFHGFHRLGEHLYMTNMAQTANVLQSLILTEGPRFVTTPTYHVYDMFMPHRDAFFLPCRVKGSPTIRSEVMQRPALSASATESEDGREIFLSVVNLDPHKDCPAIIPLMQDHAWRVETVCRLATGDLHSHNTFDEPYAVAPLDLSAPDLGDPPVFPAQSITTLLFRREEGR